MFGNGVAISKETRAYYRDYAPYYFPTIPKSFRPMMREEAYIDLEPGMTEALLREEGLIDTVSEQYVPQSIPVTEEEMIVEQDSIVDEEKVKKPMGKGTKLAIAGVGLYALMKLL